MLTAGPLKRMTPRANHVPIWQGRSIVRDTGCTLWRIQRRSPQRGVRRCTSQSHSLRSRRPCLPPATA